MNSIKFFSIACLILFGQIVNAQNWAEELGLAKKSPIPFDIEFGSTSAPEELSNNSNWSPESPSEIEQIFNLTDFDGTAELQIHFQEGNIDGVLFHVETSEEALTDDEFATVLDEFSEALGKPSQEMGKYLWEFDIKTHTLFVSLQNLAPYGEPGFTMNWHAFSK